MRQSFADRKAAGQALAERLGPLDPATTVVLALPRGGVPVAFEIARASRAPLDLVLVRKIGVPGQRELALGAVVDGADPVIAVNEKIARSLGYSEADIMALAKTELEEIGRRRALLIPGRAPLSVAGKTAVVVDDGIATGATARAALKALKRSGAFKVILAVPVAPPGVIASFAEEADETVCLTEPKSFHSVGGAYEDFAQVSDATVTALLAEAAGWVAPGDPQARDQAPMKRG